MAKNRLGKIEEHILVALHEKYRSVYPSYVDSPRVILPRFIKCRELTKLIAKRCYDCESHLPKTISVCVSRSVRNLGRKGLADVVLCRNGKTVDKVQLTQEGSNFMLARRETGR